MKRYIVDWTITGSLVVSANSADDAQNKFDQQFSFQIFPNVDADIVNDPPYAYEED